MVFQYGVGCTTMKMIIIVMQNDTDSYDSYAQQYIGTM